MRKIRISILFDVTRGRKVKANVNVNVNVKKLLHGYVSPVELTLTLKNIHFLTEIKRKEKKKDVYKVKIFLNSRSG